MTPLSQDELQAIIDADYSAIRRSAFAMCGDSWEADELAQETFVAALGGIGRRPKAQSTRAWLYGALLRIRRNRLRAAVRYAVRLTKYRTQQSDDQWLADSNGSGLESLEASQQKEELWRRVRCLPAKQMEVVVLRYLEGLRCEDIAPIVDVPTATVRSRLHHGMKRLRESYLLESRREDSDGFDEALMRTSSLSSTSQCDSALASDTASKPDSPNPSKEPTASPSKEFFKVSPLSS